MRQTCAILLVVASVLCAEESSQKGATITVGAGPYVGSDGFGGSARILFNNAFGFSFSGGSNFNTTLGGLELQANYHFIHEKRVHPYGLIGAGFKRFDLSTKEISEKNVPFPSIIAGAGAEILFGETRNHGISLECAYKSGDIAYKGTSTTEIGDNTINGTGLRHADIDNITARVVYHFYFLPWNTGNRDDDLDTVLNKNDECPDHAEDYDGFDDLDGCPDFDNDEDGIVDSLDRCILVKEDLDGFEDADGCPDYDNDGDSFPDTTDACPNAPETVNGFEDTDGCKDTVAVKVIEPVAVAKTPEAAIAAIETLPSEMITFQTGKSVLETSSNTVLNQLVKILKANPSVKLNIEGHTDNQGNAQSNKVLSQKRAAAVVQYLTSKGVASSRLKAEGYGPDKPIADNATPEGRQKNRRVELVPVQ